jgi:hypothetical protein
VNFERSICGTYKVDGVPAEASEDPDTSVPGGLNGGVVSEACLGYKPKVGRKFLVEREQDLPQRWGHSQWELNPEGWSNEPLQRESGEAGPVAGILGGAVDQRPWFGMSPTGRVVAGEEEREAERATVMAREFTEAVNDADA